MAARNSRWGTLLALLVLAALIHSSCLLGRGPAKPAVTIIYPDNNSQVIVGHEVHIEALALDESGIQRVELWVDGRLHHSQASPKKEGEPIMEVMQPWSPLEQRHYSISVKAFNRHGVASEPVSVQVEAILSGSASAPATPSPTPSVTVETPAPTPMILTPTPAPRICTNNAEFVADVTIPDETRFEPGETFEKVWRMRNTGSCSWDEGYRWVFESGDRLGTAEQVTLPATEPGAEVDLRVAMIAPAQSGRYLGRWRFHSPEGQPFGQRAIVVILVGEGEQSAPPAPINLRAALDEAGDVELNWEMPPGHNAAGFRVYTEDGSKLLVTLEKGSTTGARLTDLACNTTIGLIVRAYNDAGESSSSPVARVTTAACPKVLPVIHYFNVTPSVIDLGEKAVLSWDLEGAHEARIFPGGESGVVAPGSMEVSPATTTTYRLVATNENGAVEKLASLEVRQVSGASSMSLSITASAQLVGESERYRVTVSAQDPAGLDSIWWWGRKTGDPILDTVHAFLCEGKTACSKSWDAKSRVSGTIVLQANARTLAGAQADHTGPMPSVSIRVIPIHVARDDLPFSRGSCLDLDAGEVVACESPQADLKWEMGGGEEWLAVIANGKGMADLGAFQSLRDVSYLEAGEADLVPRLSFLEGTTAQVPPNSAIVVLTGEGRISLLLLKSRDNGTARLDLVTFSE